MAEIFFEVVVAPGFDDETLETLGKRKSLRLLAYARADAFGIGAERH